MIRVLGMELRRSPFLWVVLPISALAIAVLLRERETWHAVWPEASVQVIAAATQLPGVAVAAVAAWAAQRVHRTGTADLLNGAARPRWQIEAVQLFSSLVFSWIVLAVVSLIAGFVTARMAPPGSLWPSYLLLGFAATIIVTALGHAVGSTVNSRLAPPVAGFLSFFPLFVMSLLVPYFGEANKEVSPAALAARVAFAITCVFAALFVSARTVVGRRPAWRPLMATGSAGLAVLAVVALGPPQQARAPAEDPVCGLVERTRVCLWPENAARLPGALQATKALIDTTRHVFPYPDVVAEEGLAIAGGSTVFVGVVAGSTGEAFGSLQSFRLTWALLKDCGAEESEVAGRRRIEARAKLDTWISSSHLGRLQDAYWDSIALTSAGRQEVGSTLKLARAEQVQWARRQITIMGACGG
ncbi:hypothetical protein [Nonomuraea endophytica]|uniref:Uncharacterized protein n=1 Tax=Nonomuraea endophytica TaxID=714136 RepID=A0A7W7ZY30_9ACTN|nr:hypothetical protein [Nonomuraea endophytica]MBB5075395.1 hypothetical protein [Nonomuraea endophytica]